MTDTITENDLSQFGWSFGTYPKTCSECPPDNEFLGSKDSYLCHNHAKTRKENTISVTIGRNVVGETNHIVSHIVRILK